MAGSDRDHTCLEEASAAPRGRFAIAHVDHVGAGALDRDEGANQRRTGLH